jgi:hypothetical protein
MSDVTLEVPLGLFPVVGRRESHDPAVTGVEQLGDPLDRAPLAGGVPAFEDHHQPQPLVLDPLLHEEELDLEPFELLLVLLGGEPDDALRRDGGAHYDCVARRYQRA